MLASNRPASAHVPAQRPTLRWRIVSVLLLVSLLPLVLMGVGAWVVFGRMLERRALELQRTVVQSHAASIEAYLGEQQHQLELLAATNSAATLGTRGALQRSFAGLNLASDGGFVDLGVISADGDHLAYVGPFDLAGRNYRDAAWFSEVMANGVFVSDVFLGFRQVPHLVIAVRSDDAGQPWILRATVNSEKFNGIVRSGALGFTADAYLVNRAGRYQTAPRLGAVLDAAPMPAVDHSGVREQRVTVAGETRIAMSTWINGNRWQLVVSQAAAELKAPVRRAIAHGAIVAVIATLVVVVTTIAATWHLSRQIDRANAAREEIFRAFMRSAKLASVGELATGLAHEINNPLAIISAESTNIADLLGPAGEDVNAPQEIAESNRCIRRQVERCAGITSKMLQFGRQRESTLEPTELAPRLASIAGLLDRQARVRNINLELELEEGLPKVLIDPLELEQVVVNLINNSFHALRDGGQVRVRARCEGAEVVVEVEDNGCGMNAEACGQAFEPFFTTKPVGQGTGLGLSVCHGIVSGWGGRIELDSEVDMGTTVTVRLPLAAARATGGNDA